MGRASDADETVSLRLFCHSDNNHYDFSVSAHRPVAQLLEEILDRLAQVADSARVTQLRENYLPALEVMVDGEGVELAGAQTLAEAGVGPRAQCRIAAHPLKEKLMFCRYECRT